MKKSIILYAIPAVIAILSATACGTKLPDTTTTTTTTTTVVDAKSTPVFKGSHAQRSFYEPTDKTFYFDVVMETADDDGMVYVETLMTFKVISIVE